MFAEIRRRIEEIGRQLEGRARLLRALGSEGLAEELERMKRVEVVPIIGLLDENEQAMAERIARWAHLNQKEESTGDDYIHHVERVVALVDGSDAKVVAWLHDVVEDSEVFNNDAEEGFNALGFGDAVTQAVLRLTRGWFIPRADSYEAYIADIISSQDQLAIAVKIADLRDHLRPNCPASLRPRYELALETLTKAQHE